MSGDAETAILAGSNRLSLTNTVFGASGSGYASAVYMIMPGRTEPGTRGPVTGSRLAKASSSR